GLLARLNRAGFQLHRKRAGCSYNVGAGAAVLFGSLSGLLAGLFGIGGGFLKTPVMIRVFGMPVRVAVATALFMIVFTSTAASVTHTSLGHLSWPIALPLVAGFAFGAAMGNLMKRRISDARTEKLIAAALFLAGLSMLVHALGKG
ncbi:MAG: TSUP family transporter, partial [Bdellovibrionales bacterium]